MSRTWHSRKPRKRTICGLCRARTEKCKHLEVSRFAMRVHDSIAKRHLHRGRAFGNKLPYTTRFYIWNVVALPRLVVDEPSTL